MCKRNSQQLGKIKPNYQISTAEHTFDVNLSSEVFMMEQLEITIP
jgi:hypothetical protein